MKNILEFIEKYTVYVLLITLFIALINYLLKFHLPLQVLLTSVTIIGVMPFVLEMIQNLKKGNYGVDLIAVVGIISGLLMGEYIASALILLMLSGGELLEDYAIKTAKKEVSDLINNVPTVAHIKQQDAIKDISVDEVKVGSLILVKVNEMIPLDGVVISGSSVVDESQLTGESIPVEKTVHSKVYSGTVNKSGILEIETTTDSTKSKYAQIVKLIKEAEENKAPFVRMADRYSVIFTIITFTIAAFAYFSSMDIKRALAVLVVATPCPLILATPAAFAAGISRAAKRGIIVKDAGSIEELAKAKTMLFDKTGTLTLGTPTITKIQKLSNDADNALAYTISLEQFSVHVLAKAFMSYAKENNITKVEVKSYSEILGKGIKGNVNSTELIIGNKDLLEESGVLISKKIIAEQENAKKEGKMIIYVSYNKEVALVIHIEDTLRNNTKLFFENLKHYVSNIVMVTGDKKFIAEHIAEKAGIDNVVAECLPEDKVQVVKRYQKNNAPVVMIGDGVNDAPALATANVGIAIGGKEATAATETGDIIVMVSELNVVKDALLIAKRIIAIAKQSIFVGIGLSIILMIFSSFGYIKPVYGAFLQEAIDVVVILNALRARTGSLN